MLKVHSAMLLCTVVWWATLSHSTVAAHANALRAILSYIYRGELESRETSKSDAYYSKSPLTIDQYKLLQNDNIGNISRYAENELNRLQSSRWRHCLHASAKYVLRDFFHFFSLFRHTVNWQMILDSDTLNLISDQFEHDSFRRLCGMTSWWCPIYGT